MWKNVTKHTARIFLTEFVIVTVAVFIIGFSYAKAQAILPFGGQIVQIPLTPPCLNGLGMRIIPAGASPTELIYFPATKVYREGPPSHVGQWILGLYVPAGICVISWKPFISRFMPSMVMVGTSL